MSRFYEMTVRISGYNKAKESKIQDAAGDEWDFEDDWNTWDDSRKGLCMRAGTQGNLHSGETEADFSQRLAVAIWKANGDVCEIEILCTYLECIPFESYSFDADNYDEIMA